MITGCCYGQRLALSGCRQGLLLFIITNRGPGGWNGDSWNPLQFMGQDLVIKLTEVADNQQIFPAMAQLTDGKSLYMLDSAPKALLLGRVARAARIFELWR